MIYAQISNGVIINTIVLADASLLPLFQINPQTGSCFDELLQIDTIYPRPGIGWSFDGIVFIAPLDPDDDSGD